ncbi:MAG: SprT-like domain-containing protein [Thermodesulfobacteriota bacterium]
MTAAMPTNDTRTILAHRRAWLQELSREHWRISTSHRVALATPVMEISTNQGSWGSWTAADRTLRIAARLIEEHSWEVVRSVLKHEMAHQIVSEIFRSAEGHGPLFAKACDMLGVPAEFRNASGDLPRTLPTLHEKAHGGREGALFAKVEKILALAGSSNEHEAQLAMEKANQLLTRHNLDRFRLATANSYDCLIINHKKKRIENYQRRICAILSRHFFVRIVLADLYDAKQCCAHKTIEILGSRENVLIADYVYHFLLSRMESSWAAFRRTGAAAGRKRSYCLGLLDGFAAKLAAGEEKNSEMPRSADGENLSVLVCAADQVLTRFIHQRHPRLSRRSHAPATVFCREYQAGKIDGEKIVLHKGVENHDGNRGKQLALP